MSTPYLLTLFPRIWAQVSLLATIPIETLASLWLSLLLSLAQQWSLFQSHLDFSCCRLDTKSESTGPAQHFNICHRPWLNVNCLIVSCSAPGWTHLDSLCFFPHLLRGLYNSLPLFMSLFLSHTLINKFVSNPSAWQALLSINGCCWEPAPCPPHSIHPLNSTQYLHERGWYVGQSEGPHISMAVDKSALIVPLNHHSLIDLVCVSMFWANRASSKPPPPTRKTQESGPAL